MINILKIERMYKNSNEIRQWIFQCKNRFHLYTKFKPVLTDISLKVYKNIKKDDLTNITNILKREKPTNLFLGSITSEKDLFLYHSLNNQYGFFKDGPKQYEVLKKRNFFIEIPTYSSLEYAMNKKIDSLSFETSLSNSYLQKTLNKSISDTKLEFSEMYKLMKGFPQYDILQKKLIISCITECPYNGKTDPIYVVREILDYTRQYEFTEICLCDTTGTMTLDDFEYIVQYCIFFGICPSKLSFQFHICPKNIEMIKKMIHYAFYMGIHKFDVITCHHYVEQKEINLSRGNLEYISYDFFFNSYAEILDKKCLHP